MGGSRILVAHDDEGMRFILDEVLRHAGHDVLCADGGEEALEQAWVAPPDVVLVDLMMRRVDGFEVTRRLRADLRTRHAVIIGLAARDDSRERLAAIAAGADGYLSHPIVPGTVLAAVHAGLATRDRRR